MTTSPDAEWRERQLQLAESAWDESFIALGHEKVRESLSRAEETEELNFGLPFRARSPITGRDWEFHPTKSYAVAWLSRRTRELERQNEALSRRTLNIQLLALIISALSTLAVIANVIKSLIAGG